MMKLTRKQLFFAYLTAGLLAAILNSLYDILRYHTVTGFAAAGLYSLLFAFSWGKMKKVLPSGPYEPAKIDYRDNVKKRLGNYTFLLAYLLAIFVINLYLAILSAPTKLHEVFTAMDAPFRWLVFGFFLWHANVMKLRLVCAEQELGKCRQYFGRQFLASLLFWTACLSVGILLFPEFLIGLLILASCVYLIAILVCNLTVRKRIVEKAFLWKKQYTVVLISVTLVVSVVTYLRRDTFYLQGYINQLPRIQQNTAPITYREEDGVFELQMEGENFKILQLTDIHLGGSISSMGKDKKALDAVYQLISHTQPDLVIVTGDMTFPLGIMSMSLNNSSSVSQFAAMMRNLNIPWAFTFGNHDTEIIASLDKTGVCELYESLSFKTSGTLLYPYVQPEITGRNNQLIELYNRDGSLNQALFLIDSNAYTGEAVNDYDYIRDDQVTWYAQQVGRLNETEGRTVPSMVFFHIPLQEYRDAFALFQSGSRDVTYYFGFNEEDEIGTVCCSDHPSAMFETMVELGSTKALFCGHDHYNNISLEYQGIRLTYGMSIDYLAMPGIHKSDKQRGGTLITIYSDASFDVEQIPLSTIQH